MKPATGFAAFLARLFSNEYKNAFITRLGVTLLLGKFNLAGPVADLLSFFLRGFVGLLIEDGTFLIDISLDSIREGAKLAEFKQEAAKAYAHATAGVLDEAKKDEIRKQYLKIISKIGTVGTAPKS